MKPRYELRYFVSPNKALRIRDFVREYLDFDEYSVGKPDFSYPVHTLHLDSDDWKLYWRTVRGDQDRWKLRVRYYSSDPDAPAFCEVKHQMTDVIVKHRGAVRQRALNSILAGFLPDPGQLLCKNPEQAGATERFVAMMLELNAQPKLHIVVMREAYQSDDGQTRVTMDRGICVSAIADDSEPHPRTEMGAPLICADHTVILELRFQGRFPDWYRELVRRFELSQPLLWKGDQGRISCAGLEITPDDLIYNIVL